jgi:hypothetical protein
MIDAFASFVHFVDHLAPVWRELEPNARGTFRVATAGLVERAARRGVRAEAGTPRGEGPPVLVAAMHDADRLPVDRPAILLEHGAGQTYRGDGGAGESHRHYPGGEGRDRILGFLCPSERVADLNRAVYPRARYAVVGCPKLDPWLAPLVPLALASRRGDVRRATARPESLSVAAGSGEGPAVVVFSSHWNGGPAPESYSAWPEYRRAIGVLDEQALGIRRLTHGHPRDRGKARAELSRIDYLDDFAEVLARADVYVVDNSSTMYEFAATGRPVVALNASFYRKDVHHGLRFWELIPGPQVDRPEDLARVLGLVLADRLAWGYQARHVAAQVYAYLDGTSARRAADAVQTWTE